MTGLWSEEAHERQEARHAIQVDEAAEAIGDILKFNSNLPGAFATKKQLARDAAVRAEANRHTGGIYNPPTLGNKVVRTPDAKFILSQWSEVLRHLAETGTYPIWHSGRGKGYRLGTLDEYEAQQATIRTIVDGVTESHNDRADIIRKKGKDTPDLSPPILLPAPK
jgi:hypothetical protein